MIKKEEVGLYIAAVGGAFLLVIVDLTTNFEAATTLKLGGVMEKFVLGKTILEAGLIGLALVLTISVFFCWLYHPKDKVAAFSRGFSVFAVLNVVTPYSVIKDTSSTEQGSPKISIQKENTGMVSLISSAYARSEVARCKPGNLSPDSTLLSKKNVSSCKPYYSGFLGLGSFFNNTIGYCGPTHSLPKDERVKYLQSWETTLRNYRYSEIEYKYNGMICKGWVSDGRKEVKSVVRD